MNKFNFKLKNYTTSISAEKSINEIEFLLAGFGANKIVKDYDNNGKIISLVFQLDQKGYKLPANTEGVYAVVYGDKREAQNNTQEEARKKQAYDVSWRILKDWIHAQISIIASGQAQLDQVLLPYMFNGKRTLYDMYKSGHLELEIKE